LSGILGTQKRLLTDRGALRPEGETQVADIENTIVTEPAISQKQLIVEKGLRAIPKDIFGNATSQGGIIEKQNDLFIKRQEADIEAQKQLRAQIMKDQAKVESDFRNAELKINNTLDSFIDTVERTQDLSGAPPGALSGIMTNILKPTQLNEFTDGFLGGLVEVAAASARISMPGTRAIRAIDIFRKTTVNQFQSVESAIQTSADSFRNGLTSDMQKNPEAYIPGYDQMSREQKREANKELVEISRTWETEFKKNALQSVFKKNANLLREGTRERIESQLPVFNSIQEAESQLQPGNLFRVGDQILEV